MQLKVQHDKGAWFRAQEAQAAGLAGAALAVGRLDAVIAGMSAGDRRGALRRLALTEIEAMLWAQGSPVRREEIGRDLMEARAGSDLEAMREARWAIRRLEGQGGLADLREFLGLHQVRDPAWQGGAGDPLAARPTGTEFDMAAAEFQAALDPFAGLHDFARAPVARMLWRLADLSPPDLLIEAAVWTGRAMAAPCEALSFLPLGRHGRAVWGGGGAPAEQMAAHLRAVTEGAAEARLHLTRIAEWAEHARRATARIKGDNPAKVIAALAAHPLMSAAMVEEAAGISRMTAERLLNRMQAMGLLREITGTRRFRLWAAMA